MYFWERKNEIRDSDEKSPGCGILVKKERECGIRTPPSRPWSMRGLQVSYWLDTDVASTVKQKIAQNGLQKLGKAVKTQQTHNR